MESLIKMDKSKKCYNLGAKSATTLLIFFLVKTSLPSHTYKSSSRRMSLNRSQCGSCSTKYDTVTGT